MRQPVFRLDWCAMGSSEQVHSRAARAWPIALIAAVGLLTFARVFGAGFVRWDDPLLITGNPAFAKGAGVAFLHEWVNPQFHLYAPLTYTLYGVVINASRHFTGELSAAPLHATSVVLHVTSGVLLYLLLMRLVRHRIGATVGAIMWLIHPLQVEAVAWAGSLNTVLSGTLVLAAILAEVVAQQSESARRRGIWLAAGVALFALSLTAKPACIGAPLGVLGVNLLILRVPWRRAIVAPLIWCAVAIPFVWIGIKVQVTTPLTALMPVDRLLVMGHTCGFYLDKLLRPRNLIIDYSLTPRAVLADPTTRWLVALTVLMLVTIIGIARRKPWIAGAALVCVAGVLPASGIVPFNFQLYSTVADRYVYFALVGVAIVAAKLCAHVKHPAFWWLVPFVLVGLACKSFLQTAVWHDERTLMAHTLSVNPRSSAGNSMLAGIAQAKGDYAVAEQAYRQALAQNPIDFGSRYSLGIVILSQNRPADALPHFQAALAMDPENPRAWNSIGIVHGLMGHLDDARDAFERAVRSSPNDPDPCANLGYVYLRQNDPASARKWFERALQLDPNLAQAKAGLRAVEASR